MAKAIIEIGAARPETVPALVSAAGGQKGSRKRQISGRTPGCIVAGMDAAEALNTGKRRNYKRIARKR